MTENVHERSRHSSRRQVRGRRGGAFRSVDGEEGHHRGLDLAYGSLRIAESPEGGAGHKGHSDKHSAATYFGSLGEIKRPGTGEKVSTMPPLNILDATLPQVLGAGSPTRGTTEMVSTGCRGSLFAHS